jgi:hypothetical protein
MRTLSEVVNAYKTAVQRRRRTAMASDMERKWYAARDDGWSPKMMSSTAHSVHLHMQTNEIRNLSLVHYRRSANGTLTEAKRFATRGGGSSTYKPINGQVTTGGSVLSAVHSRNGSTAITCAPTHRKKSVTPTRRRDAADAVWTRRVDESRR